MFVGGCNRTPPTADLGITPWFSTQHVKRAQSTRDSPRLMHMPYESRVTLSMVRRIHMSSIIQITSIRRLRGFTPPHIMLEPASIVEPAEVENEGTNYYYRRVSDSKIRL